MGSQFRTRGSAFDTPLRRLLLAGRTDERWDGCLFVSTTVVVHGLARVCTLSSMARRHPGGHGRLVLRRRCSVSMWATAKRSQMATMLSAAAGRRKIPGPENAGLEFEGRDRAGGK